MLPGSFQAGVKILVDLSPATRSSGLAPGSLSGTEDSSRRPLHGSHLTSTRSDVRYHQGGTGPGAGAITAFTQMFMLEALHPTAETARGWLVTLSVLMPL